LKEGFSMDRGFEEQLNQFILNKAIIPKS